VTTLLHIDSSANRSGESVTRMLTAAFAQTWCAGHGAVGYQYRDLAADPVPPLDTAYCALGRRVERHGLVPLDKVAALAEGHAEEDAWEVAYPMITELLQADTILIGAPMYNFSIPAALKAWIDRVTFPGAFLDPGTGDSLLKNTNVIVAAARGGGYGPGTPLAAMDFQTTYLRAYFTRHGVPDHNIKLITAEMTLAELAPHLAGFRPLAEESLAAALAGITAAGKF
jgi:FMN-dependent NADH-azoreductase